MNTVVSWVRVIVGVALALAGLILTADFVWSFISPHIFQTAPASQFDVTSLWRLIGLPLVGAGIGFLPRSGGHEQFENVNKKWEDEDKKLEDLRTQLENAKSDTSENGKKKVRKLTRQIKHSERRLKLLEIELSGGGRSDAGATIQYVVFGIPAAIVLYFLMRGLHDQTLLTSVAVIDTARGLITFLIAVVTVAIALILALATVVSDSPDRRMRFQQGKEVLTVLIGVLGTIVGFYFGHSLDDAKNAAVIAAQISPTQAHPGEKVTFKASVSGAKGTVGSPGTELEFAL